MDRIQQKHETRRKAAASMRAALDRLAPVDEAALPYCVMGGEVAVYTHSAEEFAATVRALGAGEKQKDEDGLTFRAVLGEDLLPVVVKDLKDGVLTREQTVKVDDVMTVGAWLREPLLRVLHQERRGASDQPQLWDGDDDLAAEELVEKLNREELEVRDEDGRRDWDDDDLPPTVGDIAADAVDELLAAAEASRPQWRVEPGTGNATDLWVVIAPEGETPIGGAWATDGDAIVQVEERTGPLDWQQTPGGAFIAVEDEA